MVVLYLLSRTNKQVSVLLRWSGEPRAFVAEVVRCEMLTEIRGSPCTQESFAVITLAVQPRRGEFKMLSATLHYENPYPWQLENRVWGLPANGNAVSKRGGCCADEPHALVSWQRRHVLFCCRQPQDLQWQSTSRERQCIQMESQRRFRAAKRSWAIAEAAKSDPIGWSASRPCVNNFGLWYFAGRGGVRRPSPVDGHGPFRNSRCCQLGAVAPRSPLPQSRSISGQDQRHAHGGLRFQSRVGGLIMLSLSPEASTMQSPLEALMLKMHGHTIHCPPY